MARCFLVRLFPAGQRSILNNRRTQLRPLQHFQSQLTDWPVFKAVSFLTLFLFFSSQFSFWQRSKSKVYLALAKFVLASTVQHLADPASTQPNILCFCGRHIILIPLKSKYFLKELTKPFGKCRKRPKCRTTKVSYISEIRIIYFHIFTILISLSFDSNQHDVNTYTLSVFDNEPTTLVQQLSVESLRFCCPG